MDKGCSFLNQHTLWLISLRLNIDFFNSFNLLSLLSIFLYACYPSYSLVKYVLKFLLNYESLVFLYSRQDGLYVGIPWIMVGLQPDKLNMLKIS